VEECALTEALARPTGIRAAAPLQSSAMTATPNATMQPRSLTPLWLIEGLDIVQRRRLLLLFVTAVVVVTGALFSFLLPDLVPPIPSVGAAVGFSGLLFGLAVAMAVDTGDLVIRGPRHVVSAGSEVVAILPSEPDPAAAGELASAVLDACRETHPLLLGIATGGRDWRRTLGWTDALADALVATGVSVLRVDLASGRSERPGLLETVRSGLKLSKAVDYVPGVKLARMTAGRDHDAAFEALAGLRPRLPRDLDVLLVAMPTAASRQVVLAASALDHLLIVAERDRTSRVDLIVALDALESVGAVAQTVLLDTATSARLTRRARRAVVTPATGSIASDLVPDADAAVLEAGSGSEAPPAPEVSPWDLPGAPSWLATDPVEPPAAVVPPSMTVTDPVVAAAPEVASWDAVSGWGDGSDAPADGTLDEADDLAPPGFLETSDGRPVEPARLVLSDLLGDDGLDEVGLEQLLAPDESFEMRPPGAVAPEDIDTAIRWPGEDVAPHLGVEVLGTGPDASVVDSEHVDVSVREPWTGDPEPEDDLDPELEAALGAWSPPATGTDVPAPAAWSSPVTGTDVPAPAAWTPWSDAQDEAPAGSRSDEDESSPEPWSPQAGESLAEPWSVDTQPVGPEPWGPAPDQAAPWQPPASELEVLDTDDTDELPAVLIRPANAPEPETSPWRDDVWFEDPAPPAPAAPAAPAPAAPAPAAPAAPAASWPPVAPVTDESTFDEPWSATAAAAAPSTPTDEVDDLHTTARLGMLMQELEARRSPAAEPPRRPAPEPPQSS
jgi:hypothetical protein